MNLEEKINSLSEEKQKVLINRIESDGSSYGVYPLTGTQYGIWCAYQIDMLSKSSFYNLCAKIVIKENINIEKAGLAIEKVFKEHEVLSYKFIVLEGKVYQYIDNDSTPKIEENDISSFFEEDKKKFLEDVENDLHFYHFDLTKENPIKFKLIKTEEDSFVVYFAIHHLVCDGWSLGILIKSYLEAYFSNKDTEKTSGFSEYIINCQSNKMLEENKKNLDYWTEKLKNSSQTLLLPTNEKKETEGTFGKFIEMTFDKELQKELEIFSQKNRYGLQAIILSAFSVVMQRYADISAINIGMTMARRSYPYTRNMIGDIASMLVIPIAVTENKNTFDVISEVNEILLDGIEHEDIVFTELLEKAVTERVDGVQPLYQVTFAVHSNRLSGGLIDGKVMEIGNSKCYYEYLPSEDTEAFSQYLCLTVQEKEDGIKIQTEYSTKYFTEERVKTIMKSILYVLKNMIKNPSKKINEIKSLNTNFSYVSSKDEYVPKSLLNEINVNEEVKEFIKNKDVILLDSNLNLIPNGFPGNICVKKNLKLHNTGEVGYIDEENKLKIISEYSRIAKIDGKIVDTYEISTKINNKFELDNSLVYVFNNKVLVIIYSGKNKIYEEDIKEIVNIESIVLMKSCINPMFKRNEANSLAKAYINVQKLDYITKQAILCENNKYYLVYESKDNSYISLKDIINIRRASNCSNIIIGYYENIPCKNNNLITKDIDINLIIDPKEEKLSFIEEKVKNIWVKVLKHNNFTIYDKFYEIGGNSIMIINMHQEIIKEFNFEINIAELFVYNTIFDLAKYIQTEYLDEEDNVLTLEGLKF